MQLSNEPAESLAERLINTSQGAFALCGFASGGSPSIPQEVGTKSNRSAGSEAMDGVIKLARQVQACHAHVCEFY
jgi:adenosylmethionine-8-amino-7-oxononanoate aminotransferase